MNEPNPYASPRFAGGPVPTEADLIAVEVVDAEPRWRWLNYLLVPRDATLPSRCVKCGVPTDLPLRKQKVYWYSPWLFLTILISLWIFLIIVLCVQKKGVVYFAMCEEHARRRRRMIALAWLMSLGGIAAAVVGFANVDRNDAYGFLILAGLLSLMAGLIIGIRGARTLNVKYIDKHVIWLNKLPEVFYIHLPQLHSADGRNPIGPWRQVVSGEAER